MSAEVRALILAAGLGTRLRPLTDEVPKCLIEISGRPLLDHWLDRLEAAGVDEALINTHHLAAQVEAFVEASRRRRSVRLATFHEPRLLGSAGTVAANPGLADDCDACLIAYADNLSDVDLAAMLRAHRAGGQPVTMLLFRTDRPRECGIAGVNEQGVVTEFVEKPDKPMSDLANGGVYALTPEAYREVAALGAFDIGYEVLPRFVGRMLGWCWEGMHRDIGNIDALELARREWSERVGAPTAGAGRGGTTQE